MDVFKIDSGSDITFMDKQDCYSLGYTEKDCKQHIFINTNKETSRAYVRKFDLRIGDYVLKKVPIAFSSKPLETLLLGRAKIFDYFDICFHAKSKHTIFYKLGNKKKA